MTSYFYICPVPVCKSAGGGRNEGTAVMQRCGLGDLTKMGKSLTTYLHYWWELPPLTPPTFTDAVGDSQCKKQRMPQAGYPRRARTDEAFHLTKKKTTIGYLSCRPKRPAIHHRQSHLPCGLWTMWRSFFTFGCRLFLSHHQTRFTLIMFELPSESQTNRRFWTFFRSAGGLKERKTKKRHLRHNRAFNNRLLCM